MSPEVPIETFRALEAVPFLRHGFTGRVAGVDVKADRDVALRRLDEAHTSARRRLRIGDARFVFAEQIHGNGVAAIDGHAHSPVPGVDGLITETPGICLGIYVADCCAVYLVDPERRAIGLLHSGRKGTELGIVPLAVEKMVTEYHCKPARMIAQLSPCIRPPNYEVDFATGIARQCRDAGIGQVDDCGVCTASNVDRYYSYRFERGKTGRMLALLSML